MQFNRKHQKDVNKPLHKHKTNKVDTNTCFHTNTNRKM